MRPWLTLQRLETERSYLDHQLRLLRRLADEPLQVRWDRVPGDSFYDYERVRLHGAGLYQAYELLYPRDCWTLSMDVLRICGWRGLAALFLDTGRSLQGRVRFGSRHSHLRDTDFLVLAAYLEELGYPCDFETRAGDIKAIIIHYSQSTAFWRHLRPHVPRGMRAKLHASGD